MIFASWPTTWPTAPAAPETTTVSPGFGAHTSSRPKYAVKPVAPTTCNASVGGSSAGGTLRRCEPRATA
jgi:hypothetical protein